MRTNTQGDKANKHCWLADIEAKGFLLLPSYLEKMTTKQVLYEIGTIESIAGVSEIQQLIPRDTSESTPNTYSGNFGFGGFPFHTDMAHWHLPPRYLVLRCVRGSSHVKTRLVDSSLIVHKLGESELRRAIVKPRRPLNGTISLLPILEKTAFDHFRFRWDEIFIVPASKNSIRVCAAIKACIVESQAIDLSLRNSGDTLIVDNWRLLHSRSDIPKDKSDRLIERSYLSKLI